MIQRVTLAAIAIFTVITATAQNVEEIKRDPAYIYGEGRGSTIRQADGFALAEITSQISVSVKSHIHSNDKETGSDGDLTLESSFESIINTYSSATLSNTKRIIVKDEPKAQVLRYIKKSDIERIFEARKQKITLMVEQAETALGNGQVNDALRNLYWAHALTKSLRFPNELYIYDQMGQKQMVNVWVPSKIEEILSDLNIKVSRIEGECVYLTFHHKGEPVSSIEYSYFDGSDQSNIYRGEDGAGVVELRSNYVSDKIRLKVEYDFAGETIGDPEITDVLAAVDGASYAKAYFPISLKVSDKPAQNKKSSTNSKLSAAKAAEAHSYPALTQIEDVAAYQKIVDEVIIGILAKSTEQIESYFTPEGLRKYNMLIGYGSARVVDASLPKYYSLGDYTYCRNMLMSFSFKNNHKTFTESVVFEFDKDQKISDVSFGLSRRAVDSVFNKTMWPEAARIILIHFLEGYQSAYGLKQIDYIESVFAEDALIITGNKVRNATQAEMANINTDYIQYTTRSKGEYINRLKSTFARNEYININFTESEILKAGKGGEIYGIQIQQEYSSATYGDMGYLFLLVDLNDIQKPIIHVRTWQEDQDPVFGKYGLGHF